MSMTPSLPTQHPSGDWLASYSAGSLSLSQSLCVATHLEHCVQCQQNCQRLNQLGGTLISSLKPQVSHDLRFDDFMLSLKNTPEYQETASVKETAVEGKFLPNSMDEVNVPKCLQKFMPQGFQQLSWSRLAFRIYSTELTCDQLGNKVELLRIKPGGKVLTHTHLGDELTVILAGSFSDEQGVYGAGDFMACDHSVAHTPLASKDRDCICLIVTQGPIQFTGWLTRWLNPLLRRSYAATI